MAGLINQGKHKGSLRDIKYTGHKDVDVSKDNPVIKCMRTYIQVMPEDEEKSSVLIMPDDNRHKVRIMTVIKCGAWKTEIEGEYLDIMEFKVGDRVLIAELGKVEFEVDGKFVYFVEVTNVIAILKDKE